MPDSGGTFGERLLALVRGAIRSHLGLPTSPADTSDAAFSAPGAAFVTLTRNGHLRGCIGSLAPTRSLREDVSRNALAAAFRDPRFPPVTADELSQIEVEVSVLGPVRRQPCPSRQACLELITAEDGVILSSGRHSATFLPQVWEQLPDANAFLDYLMTKAGLSPEYWPPDMEVGLYRVVKYREHA